MNIYPTIFVGYVNCMKKQGEEPKLTIFARSTKICLQHWIGQIDLNRTFNTKRQYVKLLFHSVCLPLLSITDFTWWRAARQLVTIKSSDDFAHSSVMAVFRELMFGWGVLLTLFSKTPQTVKSSGLRSGLKGGQRSAGQKSAKLLIQHCYPFLAVWHHGAQVKPGMPFCQIRWLLKVTVQWTKNVSTKAVMWLKYTGITLKWRSVWLYTPHHLWEINFMPCSEKRLP